MGRRRRRRLTIAGAILAPVLASLAQVPLIGHADPSLSAPMHISSWRETINPAPPSSVVHIVGEVSNSGTDARFVRVSCKLYDSFGTVLASETTSTELDIIKQNELSPFDDIFFNPPASFDHYTCQLTGGAGTTSVANHSFTTIVTSTVVDQLNVTGNVQSNKDVPVDKLRVIFTFYKAGIVVDVDSLMANNGGSLAPGPPPMAFQLRRTADRPSWDAVSAISEAPFPVVQLPAALAFSDQIQGTTSASNNFVLTNIGTGNLHVAANGVSISGTNATDFAIAQDGCSAQTVAPNFTCTIGLTFTPGGLGGRVATISFSDDAAANPQSATLNGNGLRRPAATVSPQTLAYGDLLVNTSATKTVTVSSVGLDPVTINPVVLGGTNAADFSIPADSCSGKTVPVSSTCSITLTFRPGAPGGRTATLTITDDGRIAHDPVTLTGNGVPGVAQALFDADHLAFGSQVIGTQNSQPIHLSNPGTASLAITSIDVSNTSNPGSNDFARSGDTCPRVPLTLPPNASCTITVRFAPGAVGPRTGTLTLTANVPSAPAAVALTGTGVAAAPSGGGPEVSSWGRGRLDVFMKGADGALWHKYYDASVGWQGWSSLGAPTGVTLASDPVAISWGYARIDIFARGSDNALWHKYYDVKLGGWSGWYNHGGSLSSGPAATSWGPGRLDVFYRGSDNTLRHIYYASFIGAWSGENNHGGVLASDPSAVSWGVGRIDVVARGNDGSLQHNDYDSAGGGWLSAWEGIGGVTLSSGPVVTTWGPGRLDVFAKGLDTTLQHNYFYAGSWQGWNSQANPSGNQMTSDPGAIAWSAGRLDIFARGQANTLLHKFYDASVGWSDWFSETLSPTPG
jgi:hypothetical protein